MVDIDIRKEGKQKTKTPTGETRIVKSESTDDVSTYNPEQENGRLFTDYALSLYLEQLGRLELLSQQEEINLSKKIKEGRQTQEKLEQQTEVNLSNDEIAVLQHKIAEGKQARNLFIEANTRLVVSEAKRYRGSGLSFIDLIQDGNIGLIKAVDHFDHELGNKFSTYAVWWIRQSIRRALTRQAHIIRLPSYVRQRLIKVQKTAHRLANRIGRRPTIDEIASEMGVENTRRLRKLLMVGQPTLSLNNLVDDPNGDSELLDFIEDKNTPSPYQQVQKQLLREEIRSIMNRVLLPNELKVVRNRFGLEGKIPRTLQSLADEMKVSRERIRQIEKRALRKLRHPSCYYKLKNYRS